jgi:hypothetical protein
MPNTASNRCCTPARSAASVLLIHDRRFDRLKAIGGEDWQRIFDYRRMLKIPAVKGHLSLP